MSLTKIVCGDNFTTNLIKDNINELIDESVLIRGDVTTLQTDSTSLRTDVDGLIDISNTTDNLKVWRKALASVSAGVDNAKLLVIGDSTTAGSGGSGIAGYQANSRQFNVCNKLSERFSRLGVNSTSDSIIGDQGLGGSTGNGFWVWDGRFNSSASVNAYALNNSYSGVLVANENGGEILFTPQGDVDTFVVWYCSGGGVRSFDAQYNSETPITVDSGDPAQELRSVTLNGALGQNTLKITASATIKTYIVGIETYNSQKKAVDIIQMGRSGGRVLDAIKQPSNTEQWTAKGVISALSPDLTVVNLAINEWLNSGDVNQYKLDLTDLINHIKAGGSDVIVTTGSPTANSNTSLSTQKDYTSAIKEVAKTLDVVVYDSFGRFNDAREGNESEYADLIHPNGVGYQDIANGLLSVVNF